MPLFPSQDGFLSFAEFSRMLEEDRHAFPFLSILEHLPGSQAESKESEEGEASPRGQEEKKGQGEEKEREQRRRERDALMDEDALDTALLFEGPLPLFSLSLSSLSLTLSLSVLRTPTGSEAKPSSFLLWIGAEEVERIDVLREQGRLKHLSLPDLSECLSLFSPLSLFPLSLPLPPQPSRVHRPLPAPDFKHKEKSVSLEQFHNIVRSIIPKDDLSTLERKQIQTLTTDLFHVRHLAVSRALSLARVGSPCACLLPRACQHCKERPFSRCLPPERLRKESNISCLLLPPKVCESEREGLSNTRTLTALCSPGEQTGTSSNKPCALSSIR